MERDRRPAPRFRRPLALTGLAGVWAAGALGGLVAGVVLAMAWNGPGAGLVAQDARRAAELAAPRVPESGAEVALSFAPVARAAQPAVVNIFTARVVRQQIDPFFQMFLSQPRVQNSLGSGVILDPSGMIVTNEHVIRGAQQIIVALADRREFPAEVVYTDPRLDLALIRINAGRDPLPALPLGDSDRAEVGDLVLAIGNPFGVGQTVTQGIVSATARSGLGVSDSQFFLQTDAAINQGNSGGALVDMAGRVIGINTAIFSPTGASVGVGFAIPSNMVASFLRAAVAGRPERAWLGVEGEPLDTPSARAVGLDRPSGVRVTQVSPGSPAERAGLLPGDVIFAVNGRELTDPASLRYRIATIPVGQEATLTIVRRREVRNIAVRLVEPPENPPRQLTRLSGRHALAGLSIANLSPALALELGAGLPERGVVIVETPRGAPATRLGLARPGDILERVGGRDVLTVAEVVSVLRGDPSRLDFVLNRGGQRMECVFQQPAALQCRQVAPRMAGLGLPGA